MTRKNINQIQEGDRVDEVYRITDKQLRPNKNGNLYLQFNLSDKTGMVGGRLWNVIPEQIEGFENNDFVLFEGTAQRFQGTIQLIARKLTKIANDQVKEEDFLRPNCVDIPKSRERLQEMLRSITNPDLLNLADCFLIDEDFMERFCKAPAGVKLHHAYPGGLLDHTVHMMQVALKIAVLYPQLNRDLLLFGAFLHDIGKTKELSFENDVFYTDRGQLLGHPILGIELLLEKIAEAEKLSGETFHWETAMLLKHLMISHHGTYENQSPKLPMTLEAIALHFIDSLDSKIAEFQKYMLEDPNLGSPWTNYIPGIERKLYKGKN